MLASDFTVIVKQGPHLDAIEELPAIYWAWAEDVNEKEPQENQLAIPGSND